MKALSRDDLLGRRPEVEWVPLPAFGGGEDAGVYVRGLPLLQRDRIEADLAAATGKGPAGWMAGIRSRVLVQCCCDEQGERIFRDGDAAALDGQDAAPWQPAFEAALRLSRMTADSLEQVGKDSAPGPTDTSP